MSSSLFKVLDSYLPKGLIKAGELLLQPQDALYLAHDLQSLGVSILGVDIWYRVDGAIAEDPNGLDLSYMVNRDDPVESSTAAAKNYIEKQLPTHIELVSFVINDNDWALLNKV